MTPTVRPSTDTGTHTADSTWLPRHFSRGHASISVASANTCKCPRRAAMHSSGDVTGHDGGSAAGETATPLEMRAAVVGEEHLARMIGGDPVQRFLGEAQRQRFRRRHLQGVGQASREVAGSRLDRRVPLGREALGGLVEVLALGPVGDEPQQRAAQRHGQYDLEEEAGEAADRVGQRERDELGEQERDGRERDRTRHDTA